MRLPSDYANALRVIRDRIREARVRTVLAANTTMIRLYWDVGRMILDRQERTGWGSRVIDRLSADLRKTFPDMTGFSSRNLKYMRAFAAAWPRRAIVQEPLAQMPWYHQIALLEKLDGPRERLWYARQALSNGWSQNLLVLQIESGAHERQGRAITNFSATLPPAESDLAEQVFKDPYLFDFLGTADLRRERDVERALVERVRQFLMELGTGFAFVGRQVPLRVGGRDFLVDLLLYHLKLRCYVIVELKVVPFDPSFVGQLNLYLSAADDLLRHPDDQPSIGLILCRTRERLVVEYALRHLERPIGVARWRTKLVGRLPTTFRGSLPTVAQIEAGLSRKTGSEAKVRGRRRRR